MNAQWTRMRFLDWFIIGMLFTGLAFAIFDSRKSFQVRDLARVTDPKRVYTFTPKAF